MGTAFPLLTYGKNAYILLKMHFAVQKDVFLTLKYGKTRGRPGLRPRPRWGAHDAPPDALVSWGGDTPPQTPSRSAPLALRFSRLRRSILGTFGASNFAPSALNFGFSIVVNLRNDHWDRTAQSDGGELHW